MSSTGDNTSTVCGITASGSQTSTLVTECESPTNVTSPMPPPPTRPPKGVSSSTTSRKNASEIHKGLVIGKEIERYLIDWGISKVFTVTIDNASSKDVGIFYLQHRLERWNGSVLNGEFIHMRCCAHLLSLTVREGLKEMDDSIFRIRSAVRYVRSSPMRLQRFKECVVQEKIESKSLLVLDVETRWNSNYLMLDVTLKFQKAFDLLEIQDTKYKDDLRSGERSRGVPTFFHDATVRVYGSLYVTTNAYMEEIYAIGLQILTWTQTVFDPSKKLEYVYWTIDNLYDDVNVDKLKTKVHNTLVALFEEYWVVKGSPIAQSSEQSQLARNIDVTNPNVSPQATMKAWYKQQRVGQCALEPKSELDKYLRDSYEDNEDKNFDILTWWKINLATYPILSLMA
ncbi:zinc finger BED domain-containing protein RICESLEEPER 2-like [Pistacia vera]|uniref:zinc finger BED domain-containing protein RICESLEEPER 2-like n=1 Tax=Pistacia vera TaxID=55513 RepID=UPI001263A348|nr:zinc finger BED domain-containing protein RICESLEEPER 2-like [Pistacia vera]